MPTKPVPVIDLPVHSTALWYAMLDAVKWSSIWTDEPPSTPEDGIPYATHEGVLNIGGLEFQVYQLSDGHRVISEESMVKFFEGLMDV
jgi:hypothetical protein